MPQVKLQRQRRHQQERQRRQQRQPVSRLYRFHFEHAFERRQDERARHQSRDVGIEHDQHAPLQLDLVGVHVAFNARYASCSLSHRSVQILVEHLGARSPYAASTPARCGFSEIRGSDPWDSSGRRARAPRGTGFAAGRGESLGDAVIAQRALVGRVRLGVEEAAAVGAGLDAVAAAEAIFLVHQHHAVGSDERRADRADLHARRVRAVVAELGDEEGLAAVVVLLRETRRGRRSGESTCGCSEVVVVDVVAFDPSAEIALAGRRFRPRRRARSCRSRCTFPCR